MAEEDSILLNIDTQPNSSSNTEETKVKKEEQKIVTQNSSQETENHIKVDQTSELKNINKSLYFFMVLK